MFASNVRYRFSSTSHTHSYCFHSLAYCDKVTSSVNRSGGVQTMDKRVYLLTIVSFIVGMVELIICSNSTLFDSASGTHTTDYIFIMYIFRVFGLSCGNYHNKLLLIILVNSQ